MANYPILVNTISKTRLAIVYAKIVDEKKKAAMEMLPMIEWENNNSENAL